MGLRLSDIRQNGAVQGNDDRFCIFESGETVCGMDRITGVGLYGRGISRAHLKLKIRHLTVISVRAKNDARH